MNRRVWSILFICLMVFLTACEDKKEQGAKSTKPQQEMSAEQASKAKQGEEDTNSEAASKGELLRMGAAVDFKNNPEAATLVADTLIILDESREVLPNLVKSWEISEDYKIFTFQLPEDLKFNNGEPVTLEDFDRSLRIIGKKEYVGFADKIQSISMPDVHTLKVELSETQLYFMQELVKIGIFKASEIDDEGNIREYIGTGPYMLGGYEANVSAHLVQNPHYRNKENYTVKEVIWSVIPDGEARRLALASGQVDVIGITEHWPSVSFADADTMLKDSNLSHTRQNLEWFSIVKGIRMNWKEGPLSDISLRRALIHAIDREKMNKVLFFGLATPSGEMFNSKFEDGPKGFEDFSYDLEKAKQLLKEAGYEEKDGKLWKADKEITLRYVIGTNPEESDRAVFVQNSLKKLGISVVIETFEGKLIRDELKKGAFDLSNGIGLFEPVVTSVKFNGIEDSALGFGVNEKAIVAGKNILDAKSMQEIRQFAQEYWKEQYMECPFLPLYHSGRFAFFQKDWEGFEFTGYGHIILSNVRRKIQ